MKFPTHISYVLKVSKFEIFPNEIQIFSKTLFIYLNGRSHIIFTLGFCDEMTLSSWRSRKMPDESFGKVLLFPLIQLKKINFHSISHHHSHNNQTNSHN